MSVSSQLEFKPAVNLATEGTTHREGAASMSQTAPIAISYFETMDHTENRTLEDGMMGDLDAVDGGGRGNLISDDNESNNNNHHHHSKIMKKDCSYCITSCLSCFGLSMMSSMCCFIQLLLQLFNVGCMGFQKLSAIRPYAIAVSALILIASWLFAFYYRRPKCCELSKTEDDFTDELEKQPNKFAICMKRTKRVYHRIPWWILPLFCTVSTALFTCLPEIIDALNSRQMTVSKPHTEYTFQVHFRCAACAAHAKSDLLEQHSKEILGVSCSFQSKKMVICLKKGSTVDENTVIHWIQDTGSVKDNHTVTLLKVKQRHWKRISNQEPRVEEQ